MKTKAKSTRARTWEELPEILQPGTYYVNGVKLEIREPITKEEARMAATGIKRLANRYYKQDTN